MRKIFTLLLLLIPLWVQAQGYTWDEETKTLTIKTDIPYDNTYKATAETLIIEGTYTTITGSAFKQYSALKKVIINDGVTSIKSSAFSGCTSLKEITIPNSVTSIRSRTFENCTSLESVTMGDGVTIIPSYAFNGCTSLKEITIPDNVTRIESRAFENCSSLESVTMGDGVTIIQGYVFSGCTSLEEITIPNSVTSIGGSAFNGCTSLKEITIPNSVTSIGSYAFQGCSELAEITIPGSVTSIEEATFQNCTSLESVTMGDGVTSIGIYAFNNCTSLTNIVYEGTTKPTIGDYAFSGISAEATVTVPADYEDDSFGGFSGAQLKGKHYTITILEQTGGTVKATVDESKVTSAEGNATITLTATPDEGYQFEEFTVTDKEGNPVTVTGNTFIMPASNVTVSASFKKQSYTLTINQPTEGGSISAKVGDTEVTSSSQEVEFEKTVTLTATASDGYEFSGWNITDGNGKEVEIENNAFTMPASNVTVSATFSKIPTDPEPEPEEPEEPVIPDYPDYYNIYVDECEGVTVLTSTNVVREGNSMTFTVEVAEGYTAEDMVVKVKRSLFGYTDIIEPNEEGKYEVRNIYSEIYITIEGVTEEETPTGIEELESTAVYTQEGAIYVRTPQRATVSIVSLTGAIVKKAEQTGTQRYDLPRGIYIVDVAGQRYKIRN